MKKNLDMIAANEVGDDKAFECEDNHLIVLSRTARHDLGKAALDRKVLAEVAANDESGFKQLVERAKAALEAAG